MPCDNHTSQLLKDIGMLLMLPRLKGQDLSNNTLIRQLLHSALQNRLYTAQYSICFRGMLVAILPTKAVQCVCTVVRFQWCEQSYCFCAPGYSSTRMTNNQRPDIRDKESFRSSFFLVRKSQLRHKTQLVAIWPAHQLHCNKGRIVSVG